RVWDSVDGKPLTPPLHHSRRVLQAALSRDGRRLVTSGVDQRIQLWDVATRTHLAVPWQNSTVVSSLMFSPDGSRVLTWAGEKSNPREFRLWDPAREEPILAINAIKEETAVRFSPDATRILATTSEGFRMWEIATGKPVALPVQPS